MIRRAHVHAHGRVQGVYFRQGTVEQARERGLNGWVRNNPDGSVEAVFEGDGRLVEEMVEWCGRGPAAAKVERLEVDWESPAGESGGFGVTRGGWA
jgi:acylphosphatase